MPLSAMHPTTCWWVMPAMTASPVALETTRFMAVRVTITSSQVLAPTSLLPVLESTPWPSPVAISRKTSSTLIQTVSTSSSSRVMAARQPQSPHPPDFGIQAPRELTCWMVVIQWLPVPVPQLSPPTTRLTAPPSTTPMNSVARPLKTSVMLISVPVMTASARPQAPRASRSPTTAILVQTASR